MDLKRLEAQGLTERASFSRGQVKSNLNRAMRDLRTAKANLVKTGAAKSLESAEQFVEEINRRIEKMNPQTRLIP